MDIRIHMHIHVFTLTQTYSINAYIHTYEYECILLFTKEDGGSESFRRGSDPRPQEGAGGAAPQTAGVWVVVNHPEMSLFRGLNEAPTTKGGPACSRTACPPAPDAHNSFIQEPHVHTKAPKSIRHPATPDNAPNRLRIEGSNEGTAFRGDQTAGLPLKASREAVFQRRLGRRRRCARAVALAAMVALEAPAHRLGSARAQARSAGLAPAIAAARDPVRDIRQAAPPRRLAPGFVQPGPCEPPPAAFPSGPGLTVGRTHMQMPRPRRRLRVLTVAAPTPGPGSPCSQAGPLRVPA